MIREWRHNRMLLQAGWGHDPLGVNGTRPGELAISCRACPQPGINLPQDWQLAPDSKQWLYSLLLSQDANFKQKGHIHPNDSRDPPFGDGWGTFVNSIQYMDFLSTHVHQEEVCHLVDL